MAAFSRISTWRLHSRSTPRSPVLHAQTKGLGFSVRAYTRASELGRSRERERASERASEREREREECVGVCTSFVLAACVAPADALVSLVFRVRLHIIVSKRMMSKHSTAQVTYVESSKVSNIYSCMSSKRDMTPHTYVESLK
jgi:hypothetical protein